MKGFDFLRKVNLKGKTWLNAGHLGGCAFRFEVTNSKLNTAFCTAAALAFRV